ncbi:MAG: hypothetical protein Fues2KO_26340 [Fuerstiella sp.]
MSRSRALKSPARLVGNRRCHGTNPVPQTQRPVTQRNEVRADHTQSEILNEFRDRPNNQAPRTKNEAPRPK